MIALRQNPLFGPNKLKLGLFGLNVSNGCSITTVSEALRMSWPTTLELSLTADRDGYEALVPVARWRGFGGISNFNGTSFETFSWAAGIGQATEQICVMTTAHVTATHPIVAAKQAATIDHITNGRFAINIVCGWFAPEFEMFGGVVLDHRQRYAYAAEWMDIVGMLWTRDADFDYSGKFFEIKRGFSMPKPLQQPMPPIMNAGGSGDGRRFAAKYADMAFIGIQPGDLDEAKRNIDSYRELARTEFGREIQVWCSAYVVQADTQREADEYLRYYVVENGDDVAVSNLTDVMLAGRERVPSDRLESMKYSFKAGWGGYPLVGSADRIASELERLSNIGIDGVVLSWVDYRAGLDAFGRAVMPRLEQAGLRAPHSAGVLP
jgi:FMNH2-dependent dimethyl sulfone monooxygenase